MKQYDGPVAAITFGLPIVQVTTNHRPQVGKTTLGLYLGQDGAARVAEADGNQVVDLMINVKRDDAGKRLRDHLSGIDTFPGVLKYLSKMPELRPLLDFWEELRIIQGGLL